MKESDITADKKGAGPFALRSRLYTLCSVELIVFIAIVVVYGIATYQRNFIWKDEVSLWSDVIKKSPYKARAYNEFGMYYYTNRLIDEAMPYLQKSLSLNPDFAYAHNNLGLCFLGKGSVDSAIKEFKQAIKARPLYGMYHINLGIAYWKKGLNDMAYKEMQIGKDLRRGRKTQ